RFSSWQCPTFTWHSATLSSALSSFTSEFEMVSGGSHSLWSPGLFLFGVIAHTPSSCIIPLRFPSSYSSKLLGCYRVKSLVLLVLFSSTLFCAYPSRLSTSSSSTDLSEPLGLGDLISGEASRLDAFSGYPVRT